MKALKHLNKYFIKYKWHLISGVLFVTFSNLFSIFPAQLIRYTFDMVEQTIIQYQLLNGFDVQNEFYGLLSKSLLLAGGVVLLLALLKGVFLFFMFEFFN